MRRPQSYSGGCTPMPMNDRPANASSAPPAPIVALMISGSPMLGRMWRVRTRQSADTADAGGGDIVALGDACDEGLAEAGERRRAGEADGEHRAEPAGAEDDREEEGEQQPGERHGDADEPGDRLAGATQQVGRHAEDHPGDAR